jgi:hypothetical protein
MEKNKNYKKIKILHYLITKDHLHQVSVGEKLVLE